MWRKFLAYVALSFSFVSASLLYRKDKLSTSENLAELQGMPERGQDNKHQSLKALPFGFVCSL